MVTATPSSERPSTMSSATQLSHRRVVTTVLALLLVAATAACGTSGGDDAAATTTTRAPSTTDAPDGTDASPTSETEQTTSTAVRSSTTAGGKGSGSEQDYVDALVGSFDPEEDGEDFTRDQVTCLAQGWVKAVGVEAFQSAGVSPDDISSNNQDFNDLHLSKAQANDMVDVYDGCGIDVQQLMLKSFASDSATPKQQACLEKALTEDAIRTLLVDSILNQSNSDSPLMKTLSACMV